MLKNEAFAAKKPGAQAFGKGDIHLCAKGCAEEGVFLAIKLSPDPGHVNGNNFSRIWCGKCHVLLPCARVCKMSHKD